MYNRKSKIVLFSLFLLAGRVMAYMYLRQREPDNDFDNMVKDYEQQIEHLNRERDSLYRALSLRERQYQITVDSLQTAIMKIQTVQTQNKIQYENRRDNIIFMPDDERYRFVTDYIERYVAVLSAEQLRTTALIFAEHEFLLQENALLKEQAGTLQQSLAESARMITDYHTTIRELEANKAETDRIRQSITDSYKEQLRQQQKKTRRRTIFCAAGGIITDIITGTIIAK